MTLKEEIVQASAKVGMPEFKTVTGTKGEAIHNANHAMHQLSVQANDDVLELAKELTIAILVTRKCIPYTKLFTLIPPEILLYITSIVYISAFEAGRAFEQNRQDAAIAELLERENKKGLN